MIGRHLVTCVFLAIPLVLTACLSTEPKATEDEKQAAMVEYKSCLKRAAVEIDDGRSDAKTVAMAIKPRCASEFYKSVQVSGQGMNPQARNMFEERVQGSQIDIGAMAVLEERKERSSN